MRLAKLPADTKIVLASTERKVSDKQFSSANSSTSHLERAPGKSSEAAPLTRGVESLRFSSARETRETPQIFADHRQKVLTRRRLVQLPPFFHRRWLGYRETTLRTEIVHSPPASSSSSSTSSWSSSQRVVSSV